MEGAGKAVYGCERNSDALMDMRVRHDVLGSPAGSQIPHTRALSAGESGLRAQADWLLPEGLGPIHPMGGHDKFTGQPPAPMEPGLGSDEGSVERLSKTDHFLGCGHQLLPANRT